MISYSAAVMAARAHRFPVKVPIPPEPPPEPEVVADSTKTMRQYCHELEQKVKALEAELRRWKIIAQPRKSPSLEMILQAVCSAFHISCNDIMSPRRLRSIADARQSVCHLARIHTKASSTKVGQFLNLDHTTVLHAWRRIPEMKQKDPELAENLKQAEQWIAERMAS